MNIMIWVYNFEVWIIYKNIYIEPECYKGLKWDHFFMFEENIDKIISEIDAIKYLGESKYKGKEGMDFYRVYFDPEKYLVAEELDSLYSTPEDAFITYKVQQKFKSSSYIK